MRATLRRFGKRLFFSLALITIGEVWKVIIRHAAEAHLNLIDDRAFLKSIIDDPEGAADRVSTEAQRGRRRRGRERRRQQRRGAPCPHPEASRETHQTDIGLRIICALCTEDVGAP